MEIALELESSGYLQTPSGKSGDRLSKERRFEIADVSDVVDMVEHIECVECYG